VSARIRVESRQCGHFSDKGRGNFLSDFVQTSFMDGPYCLLTLTKNQTNLVYDIRNENVSRYLL